jgi:myo-inositol-1-phosphate synthase
MSTLRILTPGLGAVSTTLMAGVMLARRGLAAPIGSLTEGGSLASDLHASLDDIAFAAWDPQGNNALEVARHSSVLTPEHLEAIADELAAIEPMTAVFDQKWVAALPDATHVKTGSNHMDLAEQLITDMESFGDDRLVMVWCGSTEAYSTPSAVHADLDAFERGLKENDPAIAPSQIYAYAALRAGVPFANGAPNLSVDVPALVELSVREGVPITGKDFKTGQTLIKTIVGPGIKSRMLGINGWFSTNILGNQDGLVLDHPDNFRTKEVSKLGVLESILEPEKHPDLYGDMSHEVRINYYPPRGDDKEGWDNIDLFGWLGYPMQLKVNFLCRDSVLAAPIVLDLARLLTLARRVERGGAQDWLGFYFKAPQSSSPGPVVHDLFAQERVLKETHAALIAEVQRRSTT